MTNSFHSLDQVRTTLERVLAASPADETELVWFERKYGVAHHPDRRDSFLESPRLTVLIRVIEGGRQGWHRTETDDSNQIESGLRQALALAKVQPKVKQRPVLPTDAREIKVPKELLDRAVSLLDLDAAHAHLGSWCGDGASGRLRWSDTRLAIFNSHGVRRVAASTEVTFDAVAGSGPGGGRAAGSARSLEALGPEAILARALASHAAGEPGELPAGPFPVLLSPEATVVLLNVLNTFAFSGRAYLEGTSFLAHHRNVQVFDRAFNLRDDATRRNGLPFPFDLEGSAKTPIDLIVEGQPTTPALNLYQGSRAGLKATAQAVGGTDSLFGNLYLLPGAAGDDDLLAAAAGGIRIGWLDPPECFEPQQLKIRARARGVRRIEDGRLGAPLPDLLWEESLLRALARLRAVGDREVVRATPTTPFGAMSAPALVLTESDGFRPIAASRSREPGP